MTRWIFAVLALMIMAMPGGRAEAAAKRVVPLIITQHNGRTIKLHVELALTPRQQEAGLMFRTFLAKDSGMLFVFDGEREHYFWMRNTLIPLDMIFIRADGTIGSIHANAIPHDETPISSQGPAHSVLEIAGGRAKAMELKAGDRISLRNAY